MSKLRGHNIIFEGGEWLYADTKTPTVGNERDCAHCGKGNILKGNMQEGYEAYDGCLGKLPNVMNACCGHGVVGEAYIQHMDGSCTRGEDAIKIMEVNNELF